MDEPTLFADILGHTLYYFEKIRPFIPTYILLFAGSLLPIYAGAHASLHRPVSAAKPAKKTKTSEDDQSELLVEEETNPMAGFEWSDVIMYPVVAGATLAGLYWLITYLEDAAILIITALLNAYMSVFGLLGIFSFLSDGSEVFLSFIYPSQYLDAGRVWVVDNAKRVVLPLKMRDGDAYPGKRSSPGPNSLVRALIPANFSWRLRDLAVRPVFIVDTQMLSFKVRIRPTAIKILCAQIAVAVVAYYNLVDRAWWLTNLLGVSFTYSAFQLVSPTNFQIGTFLLVGLLFYDIYMVFFTPMMITVATKLDIPAKLMIPNPDLEGKSAFSMLGLGDIVIPGIIIAMALRFDIYVFYLRKQLLISSGASEEKEGYNGSDFSKSSGIVSTPTEGSQNKADNKVTNNSSTAVVPIESSREPKYQKAMYRKVTSNWGERYWLGKYSGPLLGGTFPKPYFLASLAGYVLGLSVTLVVLHVFEHGQPALLYLVPGVLGSIWLTALLRGEAGIMWMYTEDADEGRRLGIDSAIVLHQSVQAISARAQLREKTIEEERKRQEKAKVLTSGGDAGKNGEGIMEKEGRIAEHEPTRETQTEKSTQRLPNDNDSKEADSNSHSSSDLGQLQSSQSRNRRIFQLIISLPPPLQTKGVAAEKGTARSASLPATAAADTAGAERTTVDSTAMTTATAAVSTTTVDWAEGGEPLEKRRRIA